MKIIALAVFAAFLSACSGGGSTPSVPQTRGFAPEPTRTAAPAEHGHINPMTVRPYAV